METNSLLHALLVASDQSYNTTPTQGQPLAPQVPSSPSDPTTMPMSWSTPDLSSSTEYRRYDDPGTGFGAVIYRQPSGIPGKYNYIVALQGTRGPEPQDWNGNLDYGWSKWVSANGGQKLIGDLLADVNVTNQISFTGHSLGGSLAQYAAYQYVENRLAANEPINVSNVSLVTFNGLGGVAALTDPKNAAQVTQLMGGYNPQLLNGVAARYYLVNNDLVSALGGGNVNDPRGANDYLLNFLSNNDRQSVANVCSAFDPQRPVLGV